MDTQLVSSDPSQNWSQRVLQVFSLSIKYFNDTRTPYSGNARVCLYKCALTRGRAIHSVTPVGRHRTVTCEATPSEPGRTPCLIDRLRSTIKSAPTPQAFWIRLKFFLASKTFYNAGEFRGNNWCARHSRQLSPVQKCRLNGIIGRIHVDLCTMNTYIFIWLIGSFNTNTLMS